MSRDKYIFLHKNLYEMGETAIKKQYESYNKTYPHVIHKWKKTKEYPVVNFVILNFFYKKTSCLKIFGAYPETLLQLAFCFFLLQLDGCAGCGKFCFCFFRCFFIHSSH